MRALSATVGGLSLLLAAGCTGSSAKVHYTPAPPPRVALSASGLTAPLSIGLIVSGTSPLGQGADLLGPAAGARVAAFRFGQGGAAVTLQVQDDRGTSDGALAALSALQSQGVAGVVVASVGSHLDAMLAKAGAAGLPVVLPYETRDVPGATSAWYTGPRGADVATALQSLLARRTLTHPYVLSGEGAEGDVVGLTAARSASVSAKASPADLAAPVLAAYAAKQVDSVVIAASAPTQAAIVAALQGRAPRLPVLLSPSALTPAFGDSLTKLDGATAGGQFLTVGVDDQDPTAQGTSPEAVSLAAFLAADRLAAQTTTVESLTHRTPFGQEGAATADAASHDAVVALVRAAAKAGSAQPSAVATALGALSLDQGDGLAGPALDLTHRRALAATALVALTATTQDPGLRAGVTEQPPALSWFVLPAVR